MLTWTGLARLATIATLPLLFIPTLPGIVLLLVIAVISLILIHRTCSAWRQCGYGLLLLVWAFTEAQQMVNTVSRLAAQPQETLVRIDEVQAERQRIKVRLLVVNGHYHFPPLYAWLALPEKRDSYCPGQRWHMRLRLRALHARLNEGGFDAQRFALANHTPLQGRILSQQLQDGGCSWRESIVQHHQKVLQTLPMQGILNALAFGNREALPDEVRQLLRETGTAHLMAISGMHIALAASVGWLLLRGIQRCLPERAIDYRVPLIASLLSAALYTWLSGALAPAQRALLALVLWSALRLVGLHLSSWHIWTLCIGLMLFLDPLTVLSESFWLSVLAVGMLLIWYHGFPLPKKFMRRRWMLLQLMHLQLGILLLMTPLQAALFNGISLTALAANLLAIPVISCITVPLLLLAMLLPVAPLHTLLWWLADRSLAFVIYALTALPAGWWPVSHAGWYGVLIWGGLLSWRCGWWQSAPLSCCSLALSLLLWRYNAEKVEWRIDMLDVGHGLAVVISQGHEALIYDTGNRWAHGDAGEQIIVPWLQQKGMTVSQVILSHKHLDHTGGLQSVKQAWPALAVRSALAQPGHLPCYRGTHWQWGRLTFRVLWPEATSRAGNNNDSCVVKVSDGRVSLLLTGDLERDAERKLVMLEKAGLYADILQVPHHGSRTSSTPLLLRQVAGSAALASVARYNPWRMPARSVIKNYQINGYHWFDTAQSGQLRIKIYQGEWQVEGMREQILPRWYHQWFGVKRDSR